VPVLGLPASKRAASYGAKVAIAELDLVGGTCVIRGCIPKNSWSMDLTFQRCLKRQLAMWHVGKSELDWEHFITAIDKEVRRLSQLHIGFWKSWGGTDSKSCQVLDPHTLEVDGRKITEF